ncbi:uncharacterized protein LOC112639997 [Camponotus floridanus]|uniref:uncharacterized protein LOC112639997 n=1 Tax=Camponotus floridanus TaxID=104421 RepID=UPI000DC69C73|nr:uncharacterized protein LOC112639997 [Camponotus floridanus]
MADELKINETTIKNLANNFDDSSQMLASCRGEECGHEELVRCARPLEKISSNDLGLVVTKKEELNKLCPDLEAGMKCITKYTLNCMKEKQREHFNLLYTGTNQVIMELCHDGPYQDEFLKHAPCMQKVKAEYEMCYKTYQKATLEMEIISNRTAVTQEKIKSFCCSFTEYLECSHHAVRRQCGDDTARFTKDFLDRMATSLLKTHCTYTCAMLNGSSMPNLSAIMPMTLILLMRYFT